MSSEEKSNVKLLSVLSYIGPLFFVAMFSVEKNETEVKFHSRQGCILFVLAILSYAVLCGVVYCLRSFTALAEVIWILSLVFVSVSWVLLIVMGIFSALRGGNNPLPLVDDINKLISRKKKK